jgi:hypothetical protein
MNKINSTILLIWLVAIIYASFVFPTAFAQIGNFEINAAQIQVPPECSEVSISGDKATVPFQLKVFIDFSRDANITFEQKGKTIARTFTSPELLIFESDDPDEYQVKVFANYETEKTRAMFIQYLTRNNANFEEIIPYEGNGFCRTWNIKTTEKETLPTKEELIGEAALTAFEEMPLIKNAINRNTSAQSASITWLFIAVVAALGLSVSQLFVYVSRKRKDSQRGTAFDTMIKVGSKYISNFKKEHDEIKKSKERFESFLDTATLNLNSLFLDMRKIHKLPIGPEDDKKEEIAEETSILRKIYESTSDEGLGKLIKFIANKTGSAAERQMNIISEVLKKRKHKPQEINKDGLPELDKAKKIVKEYSALRYRELSDEQLNLFYRACDKLYRQNPTEELNKRLNRLSEVLNLRAKEQIDKMEKKKNE